MYNKKALSEAISKLNAAKAPKQKPDILYTQEGQWKYPGEATRIPSDTITMDGVPYPVMAYPNVGEPVLMQPGGEYYFPEADYVDEYPMMKRGGSKGLTKGKTKSLTGLNKLLTKNPLLRNYGHKLFDPTHNKFQSGREVQTLYVDPNDPAGRARYQAYQDSLTTYSTNDFLFKDVKQQLGKDFDKFDVINLTVPQLKSIFSHDPNIIKEYFGRGNDPVKGINIKVKPQYYNQRYNNTQFLEYIFPVFAKPTQPVEYKPNPEIVAKQQQLIDAGYNIGKADGIWGPKSKAAWEEFQNKSQEKNEEITETVATPTEDTLPEETTINKNGDVYEYRTQWVRGADGKYTPRKVPYAVQPGGKGKYFLLEDRKPGAKKEYQDGGNTGYVENINYNKLPISYAEALKNFVYPEVIDSSEETGYDAGLGVIKQNPNDPIANVNNPWWYEHELMHHLQNQAGAMSTYGTVGLRPNPYVASNESMAAYYNRRSSEYNNELNRILKQNPNISEEEARIRAEEDLYNNPTTTEGEARNYEEYIEAGNPSIFSKKQYQEGGTTEEELTPAQLAMMKARLAYAHMHGNPSAQRMVASVDNPYIFTGNEPYVSPDTAGYPGTHYMFSQGPFAVPTIQTGPDGQLYYNVNASPNDPEAIQFDSPEDAEIFARHYKTIAPAFQDMELTDKEIEQYKKGGYIVEELPKAQSGLASQFLERAKQAQQRDPERFAEETEKYKKAPTTGTSYQKEMSSKIDKLVKDAYQKDVKPFYDQVGTWEKYGIQPAESTAVRNLPPVFDPLSNRMIPADTRTAYEKNEARKVEAQQAQKNFENTTAIQAKVAKKIIESPELNDEQRKRFLENPEEFNRIAQEYVNWQEADKGEEGATHFLGPKGNLKSDFTVTPKGAEWFEGRPNVTAPSGRVDMLDKEWILGALGVGAARPLASTASAALPWLDAPAVIAGKTVPWLTANNVFWGVGAGLSTDQIVDPNSALRTSTSKAVDNPTFENITDAAGNVLMTGLGYAGLPYKAGAASFADDVSRAGKYLTTQTPLKNAYKLNPWAFKPNSNSAYRMIGDEKGLASAVESGYLQPSTTGSDINKVHNAAHYQIGVPSDTRKYFGRTWDRGYKGPYMAEVPNATTDVRFAQGPGGREMGSNVWTYPNNYIPLSEAKLYKQDWLQGYKPVEVPGQLPGSPNAASSVDDVSQVTQAGFLNPLQLADKVVPMLNPLSFISDGVSPFFLSPLQQLPFYGKKLQGKNMAFRKFGNDLSHVQKTKTLDPSAGGWRIGKSQIVNEGNWAALNQTNEKYPGLFEATFDFNNPDTELGFKKISNRDGVLITKKDGTKAPVVDLNDPGVSLNRRLPFSSRYVPINKEKLLNNQFQLATQLPHVQSLIEKYGIGAGWAAAGALLSGDTEILNDYLNLPKKAFDEFIKELKNQEQQFKQRQQKESGGAIELELTPEEIEWYKSQGYNVEELD
jgi:hypothetical protein